MSSAIYYDVDESSSSDDDSVVETHENVINQSDHNDHDDHDEDDDEEIIERFDGNGQVQQKIVSNTFKSRNVTTSQPQVDALSTLKPKADVSSSLSLVDAMSRSVAAVEKMSTTQCAEDESSSGLSLVDAMSRSVAAVENKTVHIDTFDHPIVNSPEKKSSSIISDANIEYGQGIIIIQSYIYIHTICHNSISNVL